MSDFALQHERRHIEDAEDDRHHVGGLINWFMDRPGPDQSNPWNMRVTRCVL
jgi:hypothetical protein